MGSYIDIRTVAQSGSETLYLLRLPLARPGFEEFLGSWLLKGPAETVLIDCGVTGSYPALKRCLDELGAAPDLLLLTHVHLDHSGAAGSLCRDFPNMRVFCFERAAKHLIAPEKLWNATAATLGEATANAYQPPLPVPAERVISRDALGKEWTVLDTPGHATHHVSFIRDFAGRRACFGGEALGVIAGTDVTSWFSDGIRRDGIRPATPPKYVPEIGRNSMKLLGNEKWDLYCSGHFGAEQRGQIVERSLAQN
ncbi:MAG: MBL fold metallo-hydrolase, partial [Pyramidobacter sp.]|nr:MBL fold metallo-hydrolase [Pyramidobacter sp.]